MRKLAITEFMTLDGVMEAPHTWSFDYWNDEIAKFKNDELVALPPKAFGLPERARTKKARL